jgi:hypothetical protein
MNLTRKKQSVGSFRKQNAWRWSDLRIGIEKTSNMARKGNPLCPLLNSWPMLALMFCSIIIIDLGHATISYTSSGLPNEGSTYFRAFNQKYLWSVVTAASGVKNLESKGRKSSGKSYGEKFIQKHIGFGIAKKRAILAKRQRHLDFMNKVIAKLQKDIQDTLDVKAHGRGGTSDFRSLIYNAQATTGSLSVISFDGDDHVQMKFLLQEYLDKTPQSWTKTLWPQQVEPDAGDGRVVRFPANKSLGSLHIRDVNTSWLSFEPWQPLCDAKSYVVVPPGKALLLDMTERTDDIDFLSLAALRPQDLQALVVQRTNIDLPVVSRMNDLHWLLLAGTDIRDWDLASLIGLSKLERLDLTSTRITDMGVIHLAEVISLKDLTLSGTKITDESIPYLLRLTRLKRLDLRNTAITENGIRRMRKDLPNCLILY